MSELKNIKAMKTETNQLDILDSKLIPINQNFIITLTKENCNNIAQHTRSICKVLNFTIDWEFDEILYTISKLDAKNYPQLFIFVISAKSFGFSFLNQNYITEKVELLKKFIHNLFDKRSLILQLTSFDENITKIYYKVESCKSFAFVDANTNEDVKDFPTFLIAFLSEKCENYENEILEKLPSLVNSSLVLKFLNTLDIYGDFYNDLVFKCAEKCKAADLLAITDGFIDDDGKIQGNDLKYFLCNEIDSKSILHTAILNRNEDIIKFFIKYCSEFIQELKFEHQVKISTLAFATNQIDVLCDLLQISDFPFPKDLNPQLVDHVSLKNIIDTREKFHNEILTENLENIEKFAKTYPNHKFAYNVKNKSAFCQALDSKKYSAFYKLKALRFQDHVIEYRGIDCADDKKIASKSAGIQRNENVDISVRHEKGAVLSLWMRSFIYQRDNNDSTEEYNAKIKEWYKQIYNNKLGSKFIDAAAQCDKLKIIYDFECDSVENVDVSATSASAGTTHPGMKYIFVGAKLGDQDEREKYIKGVIAHELCHYVMRLVYQNNEKPYYKGDTKTRNKFDEIIKTIEKMLTPQEPSKEADDENKGPENLESNDEAINVEKLKNKKLLDDECEGIISSVITLYEEVDWQPEMIVRPAQILARFDNDAEKIAILNDKYNQLFEFCEEVVIPELEKFNLELRNQVINLNNHVELLPKLQRLKIEFVKSNDFSELLSNQIAIVISNVPKLLMINIYQYLNEQFGNLFNVKTLFIDPNSLHSSTLRKSFEYILTLKLSLYIFVDCSRGIEKIIEFLPKIRESKIFLIDSSEKRGKDLKKFYKNKELQPIKMTVNFNWLDLTVESHKNLLKIKAKFQNSDSDFELSDLILSELEPQDEQFYKTEEFVDIFDDQTLNLLVEGSEIVLNYQKTEDIHDKNFEILFQTRTLVKHFTVLEPIKVPEDLESEKYGTHFGLKFFKQKTLETKSISRRKSVQANETKEENELEYQVPNKPEIKFEEVHKSEIKSQDQMMEDVKNQKYVLISDKAGSGKSWMMKNFCSTLRGLYSKKWISFVDLKQYIKKLKKQKGKLNFLNFMVQNILQFKSKFEEEIFRKLYKNGQVSIFFDGFDEIAPDCAEFVTKLFRSFEQNGGNQLWIATRDYFEVNLKKELNIDAVYKLDEFTEVHGTDLIASSWMLSEISPEMTQKPKSEILKQIKSLPNFKNYLKIAKRINKKVSQTQVTSIGSPQFYKMIGDILRNNKNSAINFTTFTVFEECVNIQYERWSQEKGELRTKANTESLDKRLNFNELHQLIAMKGLYPKKTKFCDLDFEDFDWSDEEVIACGLLCKIGDDFFFFHETYREFHVAKFVIRILTKPKFEESICIYLYHFLYLDKYGIVRMFLNEAFGETSFCKIIDARAKDISNAVDDNDLKICNLSMIVNENLQNLVDFVIKILKCRTYKRTKKFVWKHKEVLEAAISNKKIFIKIQDFIIDFLNENDLKKFLLDNLIVIKILRTNLNIKTTEFFIRKIINKLDSKFISELLLCKNNYKGSFLYSILSEKGSDFKFKKALQIVDTFLGSDVIIELVKQCNYFGDNFFYVCFVEKEWSKLGDLFAKLKEFVVSVTSIQQIKELLVQNIPGKNFNFIQGSGNVKSVEFQNDFWCILRLIFKNREELKNILTTGIRIGKHAIYYMKLLIMSQTEDLIDIVLNHMMQMFNKEQYEEILETMIKKNVGSLLLSILNDPKKFKISFQYLWKLLRNCCKSNGEFIEYLKRVDDHGYNIFHCIVVKSTSENFNFMIKDLEEFATTNEIKNLLNLPGEDNNNLLLVAAIRDVTFEFYEILWKTIQKYFDPLEIIEMIVATDEEGIDVVLYTIENCPKEILDLLWNEIRQVFLKSGCFEGELSEIWNECFGYLMNFLEDVTNEESKKAFNDKWEILVNKVRVLSSFQIFPQVLNSDLPLMDYKILHRLAPCDSLEHHVALWEKLLVNYSNKEELKNLILQQDSRENNFIHLLLKNSSLEVIKFTFGILKKNLTKAQYCEVIRSKGEFSRNLLQIAFIFSKNFAFIQYLWQIIYDSVSNAEMYEIVFEELDIEKNNTICYISCHATSEILEFAFSELEKIEAKEKLKEILFFLENSTPSFVWLSIKNNKSFNFHKSLWKIIQKYLSTSEILDMINQIVDERNTFIIFAIKNSSTKIAEFLWNVVANAIKSDNYLKDKMLTYLNECQLNFIKLMNNSVDENAIETMTKAWKDLVANFKIIESYTLVEKILNEEISVKDFKVLHKLAFCKKIEFHEAFWEILLEIIETKKELKNLILKNNKEGNNFLHHLLVVNNKDEIIKFTFVVLKNFMLQENLESKEKEEKSFLYRLQCNIKNSLPFQKLKKKYSKTLSKRNEEFLKILKKVNCVGRNIFHNAIKFTSSQIVEFIFDELERIGTNKEIKEILQTTGYKNGNLLHEATYLNKSVNVHEKLWQTLVKYLNNSEILDFVKHKDGDGDNIFHNAVYWNNVDVVKLTWNEIINFIDKKEDQIEYLNKLGHFVENLIKMSSQNRSNDKEVKVWVTNIMIDYEIEMNVN